MQSHTILFMECGFVVPVYMEQQEQPPLVYISTTPKHMSLSTVNIHRFFSSLSRSLHNDS